MEKIIWIILYYQSLTYDWQLIVYSPVVFADNTFNQLVTDYVLLFLITSIKRKFFKNRLQIILFFSFISICLLSWEIFKSVIGVIFCNHLFSRMGLFNFKDDFGLLKVRPILKQNFPEYYILVFWERQFSHSWGTNISENCFDGNYGS